MVVGLNSFYLHMHGTSDEQLRTSKTVSTDGLECGAAIPQEKNPDGEVEEVPAGTQHFRRIKGVV